MIELILQLLGELLIQGVMELAGRSLVGVFSKRRNPFLATLGSFLWGVIAGGISLALMPAAFIGPPALKLLNLVLAPVAVGLVMAALGRLRARAGTPLALLDQFGYAFTFALAIALVRYIWAK
jgi:hypothetical protein